MQAASAASTWRTESVECVGIYTYVYMHMCMYVYICMYMYVYIYIYMCVYIYTYIYTGGECGLHLGNQTRQ